MIIDFDQSNDVRVGGLDVAKNLVVVGIRFPNVEAEDAERGRLVGVGAGPVVVGELPEIWEKDKQSGESEALMLCEEENCRDDDENGRKLEG